MNARPRIRLASWPPWYTINQYLPLLYRALSSHGIEHVPGLPFDWRTLRARDVSVLHLHWPEPFWREGRVWPGAPLLRLGWFRHQLNGLARAGIPVVWTVHNLDPHEGGGLVDHLGYRLLHRRAALRVFHSAWAERTGQSQWPGARGPTLVMPHGNYDGVLPLPRAREVVRRAAGLDPDRPVLLCIGQMREYKGVDVALAALPLVPQAQLVIAGRPVGRFAARLRREVEGRADVTLVLRDLTDQEVADWFGTADLVLLPYRHSSGSGVLLHALTMARAVVASDLPAFRDVAAPMPGAVELVTADDPRALADGVRRALARPADERSRAARALADRYRWDDVVVPLAAWLTETLRGGTAATAGVLLPTA